MAVHMPDIGSNPNSGDSLSPNTTPKGSSPGDSFLALLALATDNSQSLASPVESSSSPHKTSKLLAPASTAKATARPANNLSANLAKASASYSSQPMPEKAPEAKITPAKTKSGNAPLLIPPDTAIPEGTTLKLSVPASVPMSSVSLKPVTADLPRLETDQISPVKTTPTGMTAIPTPASSVPIRTASVASPSAAQVIPQTTAEVANTTGVAAVPPLAPSVPIHAASVAKPSASDPVPAALGTFLQTPQETAPQEFSSSKSAGTPNGIAPATRTSSATSTVSEDPDQRGDNAEVSTQGTTTSDNLVSVFAGGDQGHDSTKPTVVAPAIQDYINSLVAPSLAYHPNVPVTGAVAKSTPSALPVRHNDPEPTYISQTHQESMSASTPPPDTTQSTQHPPSVKETAKTGEHTTASAAHPSIASDKPSPAPLTNNSGHSGTHDDSNAAQSGASELKATPQSNGTSSPDARSTFSDAMASKLVGITPTKETSTSSVATTPVSSAPLSQPAEAARTQSTRTDADYSDQQPALAATTQPAIHSAKLVAQAAQSELRVGFHAGEFGNVDIRTSMVRSQLTAEISVEHGELRNLLAVELPHLQAKLAEHPFTATNIALNNHTGGGSSNSKQAYQQNAHASQGASSQTGEPQSASALTSLADSQLVTTQLDVHA